MPWDVFLLEEVDRWYLTLDAHSAAAVAGAIDLLEQQGPSLGRPTVDRISGSRFHNMKEVRPAATISGSCSSSIPNGRPFCCWAATRPVVGKTGTTRTFRSLSSDTKTG